MDLSQTIGIFFIGFFFGFLAFLLFLTFGIFGTFLKDPFFEHEY